MSMQVRCLICSEVLECDPNDTANLVEHVRHRHPEVKLQSSSTDILNSHDNDSHRDSLRVSVSSNKNQNHPRPQLLCRDKTIPGTVECHSEFKTTPTKRRSSVEFFVDALSPCTCTENNKECLCLSSKHTSNCTCALHQLKEQSSKKIFEIEPHPSNESFKPEHRNSKTDLKISDTECNRESSQLHLGPKLCHSDNDNVLYRRKYSVKNSFPFSKRGKEKLYKTSIEKWRPGRGRICCPSCGAIRRPVIKSHLEKSSSSPIGAAFIITCWPFCFLPCLFPPPAKEYLHCSVCNHFLGIYDRKTELIEPADTKCGK